MKTKYQFIIGTFFVMCVLSTAIYAADNGKLNTVVISNSTVESNTSLKSKKNSSMTKPQSANTTAEEFFDMPSLEDERAAYTRFGWIWAESAEPNHAESTPNYVVVNPNIHGDTEGDDLWSYLMMYERTGQQGYLDRAAGWRQYFLTDYRQCTGLANLGFCRDHNWYGLDHLWGWGLVAWYEKFNDSVALAEAEKIAEVLEILWSDKTNFRCLPASGCTGTGTRQIGRHLHLVTRVAEATGKQRWITLRDTILDQLENNPNWSETHGMYFFGPWSTNTQLGIENAWENGARIVGPLQIGALSEALDHAYRITGKQWIRDYMVAMARFVKEYGLDPNYRYTGSLFGIINGAIYHNYSASGTATFWDPNNTTMLVNTLVRGYRYTCEIEFHEAAREFFIRGNGGIYGEPVKRRVPDGVVHHFVDSVFRGGSLAHIEGELHYTYLLFKDISSAGSCTTQVSTIFANDFEEE